MKNLIILLLFIIVGCKEESAVIPPSDTGEQNEVYFVWDYVDGNRESIFVHVTTEQGYVYDNISRVQIIIQYATLPKDTISRSYNDSTYRYIIPLEQKNVWGVAVNGYAD